MSKRENEISFLKHQVGSLERSILICYTFVPKARELRNTISELKHEVSCFVMVIVNREMCFKTLICVLTLDIICAAEKGHSRE